MRVLMWHGWLLEGSGSNVHVARLTERFRAEGHDVLLLCQERHPERFDFIDALGSVGASGVGELRELAAWPAPGRAVLLRPRIGGLLPVFVYDRYEGFEVKRFIDLGEDELEAYLSRNVEAVREAARWHGSEAALFGHVVPGAVIGRRALGPGRYAVKVHGSDLEYAVRPQERYRRLAEEGLTGAVAVTGPSLDALERTASFVPAVRDRLRVIAPGVEIDRFRPRDRREGLEETVAALEEARETERGRPAELDEDVAAALERRDGDRLDALARTYDQNVPDAQASARLRALARVEGPLIGYIGKFIAQKGVHHLLGAVTACSARPHALIIGFGTFREWLAALVSALDRGDVEAVRWIDRAADIRLGLDPAEIESGRGLGDLVTFTGRLDHRFAPPALSALDVLVVPSVLEEAFGLVAAEGAASGALPLVARHSGLAEVAGALEAHLGRPGLLGFDPEQERVRAIAEGLDRLLALPPEERAELRAGVAQFARSEWTWDRTAQQLLEAAAPPDGDSGYRPVRASRYRASRSSSDSSARSRPRSSAISVRRS